jgi:hypothetical protein
MALHKKVPRGNKINEKTSRHPEPVEGSAPGRYTDTKDGGYLLEADPSTSSG